MSLQLLPELAATVQGFLSRGGYKDEEEVLREALVALKERDDDLADILEGIEDEAAGRTIPWEAIDEKVRTKFGINKTE